MTNRAKKQEEDASFSLSLSLSLSDNAAGTIPLGNRLLSRLQTLQLTNSRNLFHRAVAESCGTRVSFAEEQLFVSSRGTSASRNSNQERERERERDREREREREREIERRRDLFGGKNGSLVRARWATSRHPLCSLPCIN